MDYDSFDTSQLRQASRPSGITGWLVARGMAKDAKQANIILLVVIVLAIVLMFIVGFGGGPKQLDIDPNNDPTLSA